MANYSPGKKEVCRAGSAIGGGGGPVAVGSCVLFSYALVLWTLPLGSIAEAVLREGSVILVVLFGMRYLKEPFGRPRLLACARVLVGMLIMKL